ncbi:hypothetical protein [Xanthomonas theicola]|uniref:Uncharacterized protein n=1 Tax=Xanthomonas theicola TaxID=56464 RepID=A0A2S6Z6V7_9XANT|nr:hypothetical protein [Xanthomonas theicola]PPT77353.1 hypothetical protein XthCFBP4691_19395 [Xanthomonas theicola]QNH26077.1 hypothetical protein G4Q83_16815 [Xanthomonas theicola]
MNTARHVAPLILTLLVSTGCQPRKTGMFSTLEMGEDGLVDGYGIFIIQGDRATGADTGRYAIV